jgi:RNA polymerase sigma-32 factor
MAFKYFYHAQDIRDIIQEGNNGLVYAATKFDPNKGVRFFSYALYWVRAYILRSLMENKSIVKIGTNRLTRDLYHGLIREKNRLEENEYDGNISKQLAKTFNCSETQIDEMLAWLTAPDTSLDAVVHSGVDEPDTGLDFLEDPLDVEDSVIRQEEMQNFRKKIQVFKKTLNERDKAIFDNAYLSEEPMSLQAIGDKYGISKQRVGELEKLMMVDFKKYVLTGKLHVRKVNGKKKGSLCQK